MRKAAGLLLALTALAVAAPWSLSLDANLTTNQNAYSNNWGGNATGLLTWAANNNFLAERQFNSWLNNKNTVKLGFGESYAQDTAHHWMSPVKSTDLVDLEAVLRFTLGAWVDPFASGRLESQFLDESEMDYKRLFNPLTFTEGLGVARVFLKKDKRELTSRFGAGLKQVLNQMVLDTATHVRANQANNYGGLTFDTDLNTPLVGDKISLTSKLTIFQALFYSEAGKLAGKPNANYWQYPDVGWENTLTAGITKLLMVNLYGQLLYDREIDAGMRLKETLALGLTYRLL